MCMFFMTEALSVVSDPGLVFQASLTSAQVLLPGSQASLSSLLLEGHSLLALAAVMFAPGGIDQVIHEHASQHRNKLHVKFEHSRCSEAEKPPESERSRTMRRRMKCLFCCCCCLCSLHLFPQAAFGFNAFFLMTCLVK